MTYKEWAEEYFESAGRIKEKITELKIALLTVPAEQLQDINFRISSLYQMYLDCMHTAENLVKRKGVAF